MDSHSASNGVICDDGLTCVVCEPSGSFAWCPACWTAAENVVSLTGSAGFAIGLWQAYSQLRQKWCAEEKHEPVQIKSRMVASICPICARYFHALPEMKAVKCRACSTPRRCAWLRDSEGVERLVELTPELQELLA